MDKNNLAQLLAEANKIVIQIVSVYSRSYGNIPIPKEDIEELDNLLLELVSLIRTQRQLDHLYRHLLGTSPTIHELEVISLLRLVLLTRHPHKQSEKNVIISYKEHSIEVLKALSEEFEEKGDNYER